MLHWCALCCLGVLLQKDDGPLTVRRGFFFFFPSSLRGVVAFPVVTLDRTAAHIPEKPKLLFVLQTAFFWVEEKGKIKGKRGP